VCVRACTVPCCACTGARARLRFDEFPFFLIFFPPCLSRSLFFTPLPLFSLVPSLCFYSHPLCSARMRVCEEQALARSARCQLVATHLPSRLSRYRWAWQSENRISLTRTIRDEGERVLKVMTVVELLREPRRCPLQIFSRLTVTSGIEGIAKWLRAITCWSIIMRALIVIASYLL